MLIYRVEHPETKCGPYNSGCITDMNDDDLNFLDEMIEEHSNDSKYHPVASYDFKKNPEQLEYDSLCACPTLDTLYEWFAGWLDDLFHVGFKIYEIEVSKAFIGKSKRQVVFLEEDIISMKEIN
jgi:hypothetical protein